MMTFTSEFGWVKAASGWNGRAVSNSTHLISNLKDIYGGKWILMVTSPFRLQDLRHSGAAVIVLENYKHVVVIRDRRDM